jgi:hypothetical protein
MENFIVRKSYAQHLKIMTQTFNINANYKENIERNIWEMNMIKKTYLHTQTG